MDVEDVATADGEGKQESGAKRRAKGGDLLYRGKWLCVNLEENPKWNLLRDVLEEIQATRAEVAAAAATGAGSEIKLGPTLVIVNDDRTASQV